MPQLHKALAAFPIGSEEYKSVVAMIKAGMPIFGEPEGQNLVPQAIAQMAQAARPAGPLATAPAPGLNPAPLPAAA